MKVFWKLLKKACRFFLSTPNLKMDKTSPKEQSKKFIGMSKTTVLFYNIFCDRTHTFTITFNFSSKTLQILGTQIFWSCLSKKCKKYFKMLIEAFWRLRSVKMDQTSPRDYPKKFIDLSKTEVSFDNIFLWSKSNFQNYTQF